MIHIDQGDYMTAYWLLLYDGDCSLCRRFASWIQRFDTEKKIDTLPYQEYVSDFLLQEELETDVHMLGHEGEVLVGSDVVSEIVKILPPMRPFRWMLKGAAGNAVSRGAYAVMKHVRNCRSCDKSSQRHIGTHRR